MSIRGDIYADIEEERKSQDDEWGGPAHDDRHSLAAWLGFMKKQQKRASDPMEDYTRDALVKIAALAVAALESLDRREASDIARRKR